MKQGREIKKLGEVAIFVNGDRGKNYPSQHDFVDDGVPFINAGHLVGGSIDFASMNYISEEKYNQLGAGKIVNGDILFCLRGSLGKRAIVKDVNYGAIASSLVIIRSKNVLINRYLFHYLGSQTVQNLITKNDNGSSQPNLSAKSVSDFSIPIPPREEQERIVAELDCLSGVIEKKREQLKELDALAQSIFYQMFGDPITNEKGWEVKKLGEVCKFSQGVQVDLPFQSTEKKSGWNRFLRIVDYTTCNTDIRYVNISNDKYFVNFDDVVVVRYGASAGFVGIEKEGILANNLFKLNHDRNKLNYKYLYYLLSTDYYKDFVKDIAFGAAMPALSFNSFKNFNIYIPPIALQQEYAEKIEAIEKQKELIKKSISETENLFNARMDYYFN